MERANSIKKWFANGRRGKLDYDSLDKLLRLFDNTPDQSQEKEYLKFIFRSVLYCMG